MIDVEYTQGDTCRICAKGHAGYNPGNDIVCAGVSAILYSLAGYMLDRCLGKADMSLQPGDACIQGPLEAKETFRMALIGLKLISRKYPDYIRITGEIK